MKARVLAIWADLRRGRHADVYFAVVAAFVVGVLGLSGVASLRWIGPVLLLCLVPLLNLMLSIHDRVGQADGGGPVPTTAFPLEPLQTDWKRNTDLLLVGVTLFKTLRLHEDDMHRRLQRGKTVRVLVVDPGDETSMFLTDDRRLHGPGNAVNNASEGRLSLAELAKHATAAPGSSLEVRKISFPIALGGFSFSPGRPDARLYVETYPFRTPETQPHFLVTPQQGHWFDHFTLELENMWAAGNPVDLVQ